MVDNTRNFRSEQFETSASQFRNSILNFFKRNNMEEEKEFQTQVEFYTPILKNVKCTVFDPSASLQGCFRKMQNHILLFRF